MSGGFYYDLSYFTVCFFKKMGIWRRMIDETEMESNNSSCVHYFIIIWYLLLSSFKKSSSALSSISLMPVLGISTIKSNSW